MTLAPLDIQNKAFPAKMRGYNQDEVGDFLDLVIRDYGELTQRNRELEKAVKHSEEKLEYFNKLRDTLNQSITVAQGIADKAKTGASRESKVIVTSVQNKADGLVANTEKRAHRLTADAEEKARKILTDTTGKARQLTTETEDLKKRTRIFHQCISLMLGSRLEQVKSPEWGRILQPFSSYVIGSHEVIREVLTKQLDNKNDIDVSSDTEVIEAPITTFDIQAINISIVPGEHENEQNRKTLYYS